MSTNNKRWIGREEKLMSCTLSGNVNSYSHYGRPYGDSIKKKKKKLVIKPPSVQFSYSATSDSFWPHEPHTLSNTNSWSPLKPMSIESVMPSNHLILCFPLLLLPSIFPSIVVFSNESALHIRWPKYWNFSFNISPSNEHSGLISFRIDSLDLLAVQGTLKSLLQHYSSKTLILRSLAFFIVQLSHP